MSRLGLIIIGVAFLASTAHAGCRDMSIASDCGLELFVAIEDTVFAPQDSIVFKLTLSNRGKQPAYIMAEFFQYGVSPFAVLPSGRVESFEALPWVPDCDRLPSEGDIFLEVGESYEFEKVCLAYPEPGLQKWHYEGLLWGCRNIQYSRNCEMKSNILELVIQSER